MTTEQENELIHRMKCGDQTAFSELYQHYSRFACGTALLLVRDYSTASDVCQDAFVRVFENIGKFTAGKPFKPWFCRIIVNEAMRLTRRIMRWPKPMGKIPDIALPDWHGPESVIIDREQAAAVRAVVSKLPAKLRIPIVLRYYTDLTEDEIARTLNVPLGTVKSRLNRGRQRLGILLQETLIPLGGIYHA